LLDSSASGWHPQLLDERPELLVFSRGNSRSDVFAIMNDSMDAHAIIKDPVQDDVIFE